MVHICKVYLSEAVLFDMLIMVFKKLEMLVESIC